MFQVSHVIVLKMYIVDTKVLHAVNYDSDLE